MQNLQHIDSELIRDNRKYGNVGDFLKDNINPQISSEQCLSSLSIVSAYFTPWAYHTLKEKLDNIKDMRFLFGEPTFVNSKEVEKFAKNYIIKNDLVIQEDKSSKENEKFQSERRVAEDCANWIKNNNISIKSMVKPNFLHGKMYYIENYYKNNTNLSAGNFSSIVGSSNFTISGLGLNKNITSRNMELNVITDSNRDQRELKQWFDLLWNSDKEGSQEKLVRDVKKEVLSYLENVYSEKSPEFVYEKTLSHIFEKYLSEQQELDFGMGNKKIRETKVWQCLYKFQEDGVKASINKIEKNNGCILADSVGLGKTFEALAIITYFRNKYKTKILVICPKKLSENWEVYRNNDVRNIFAADDIKYDILYHTDLGRESGKTVDGISIENIDWKTYGLIVIDESHNFRNNNPYNENSRYQKLIKIIKENNPRVLLLSATPVNNNLNDLKNQIHLITSGKDDILKESVNISNISGVLKTAQAKFNLWAKSGNFSSESLVKELIESPFIKLMDELTISRSRKQIEEYYKDDMDNNFKFPTREKNISLTSQIDLGEEDKFPSFEEIYKNITEFELSIYNPSRFVKPEYRSSYNLDQTGFDSQENREKYLIGMIRANFLKRLESSIKSFELSIERTIYKINDLIDKISKNLSYSIDTNQEMDESEDDLIGKLEININHIDKESYLLELKKDLKSLEPILKNAKKVNVQRDGKLNDLKNLIQNKVSNPLNTINGIANKKVVIFTAFSETAEYLYENIKDWAKENLNIYTAVVTGSKENCKTNFNPSGFISMNDFNSILINFSPNSKNRKLLSRMPQTEEIDILIATDCISEGQNLQDSDYLINFDIHWNPVKLIQRFGRIDRLGSKNEKIQMANFWPVAELDQYINLESRVKSRMALVDISASGDDNILHDDLENIENKELKYRNQQLEKLKDSPLDLEENNESVTLNQFNFDSFRMDIANFIQKSSESFKKYPSGLYAVVPSPEKEEFSYYKDINLSQKELVKSGVIFCLKYNSEKSYKDFEKINPLHPYFLVYIDKNGNTVIKNNNPKHILNIYHLLCKGVNKPFEESCKEFNLNTNNGENMSIYGSLLKESVKWIKQQISISVNQSFQTSIDFEIPDEQENVDESSFELITWLVIN